MHHPSVILLQLKAQFDALAARHPGGAKAIGTAEARRLFTDAYIEMHAAIQPLFLYPSREELLGEVNALREQLAVADKHRNAFIELKIASDRRSADQQAVIDGLRERAERAELGWMTGAPAFTGPPVTDRPRITRSPESENVIPCPTQDAPVYETTLAEVVRRGMHSDALAQMEVRSGKRWRPTSDYRLSIHGVYLERAWLCCDTAGEVIEWRRVA